MTDARHWIPFALALLIAAPTVAEIETIEVTSQKRDSTLQETNISITALTATDLEDRGVVRVNELTEFVPNMNFQPNSNGNGFFVSSRGIAQADATNITRDPTTAIYIDGVYWGMTIGNLMDVLDIQRVEALRGPQGDLYGRNSTSGAINIVTRKPTGGTGMVGTTKIGNYHRADFRGYGELGLYDGEAGSIAMNLGFATINRDPYFPNAAGPETWEEDRTAFRTAIRGIFGEFTGDLVFDYNRAFEQGVEMQLTTALNPGDLFPGSPGAQPSQLALINGGAGGSDSSRATRLDLNGPTSPGRGLRDDETENLGISFNGEYQLPDLGVLGSSAIRSITGYRRVFSEVFNDRDGVSQAIFEGHEKATQWQFTQEFNWIGSTSGDLGTLDYVAGLFIFHEEGELLNEQSADGTLFTPAVTRPRINNDAYAVFSHLAYILPFLDERMKVEGGVRYTFEDRAINQFAAPSGQPLFRGTASDDFDEVTGSARISFDLLSDLTVYASFARGFTSGGFNGRATTAGTGSPADLDVPYRSETLNSYEAGFKWQGFDDRVRVNFAGFWMDYEDLQRTSILFLPGGFVQSFVLNAEEAEIAGVELEVLLNPIDNLFLNVGYGWAKTDYGLYCDIDLSFAAPPDPRCPAGSIDFSDVRNFANTPEHNVTAGAQYTIPFSRFDLIGRIDYYWQSETVLQNGNNPLAGQGDYNLLHARLAVAGIQLPDDAGTLDIAFWGRNLTDEEYRPFGIDFGEYIVQTFGERRTYGVDLTYRFGTML